MAGSESRQSGPWLSPLLPIVVVGVAIRVRQFLAWRSLWMDEAMLALNVVSRPLGGLLDPLDYNQGAPVGFLLLQKLATVLFGETDAAMRVVPLLASCIAMVLFARVAVSWTGSAGIVAAALFAIGPLLVDYAVEAKQYPVDVAVTVAILATLHPWVAGSRASTGACLRLALVGAAAVWLSHPAAFVLAGAGLVVAWNSFGDGRAALARTAGIAATWTASVALLYELSLRSLSSNSVLTSYWKASFAPFGSEDLAAWSLAMTQAYLRDAVAIGDGPVGWILVAAGLVSMAVRRVDLAVALAVPLALAWIASGLGLYPYSGRMLLFAVPTTLLLAAEALARAAWIAAIVASRLWGEAAARITARLLLAVTGLGLLAQPVAGAWRRVLEPRHPEAIRPALEYMLARRDPDEPIYVYYGAKPAVNFYTRSLPIPADDLVAGRAHRADPAAYRAEVRQLLSHPGAWVVLSHNCPNCRVDEWSILLSELDSHGERIDSFVAAGAAVHRYRFRAGAPAKLAPAEEPLR